MHTHVGLCDLILNKFADKSLCSQISGHGFESSLCQHVGLLGCTEVVRSLRLFVICGGHTWVRLRTVEVDVLSVGFEQCSQCTNVCWDRVGSDFKGSVHRYFDR